jgi:hypothetical protein
MPPVDLPFPMRLCTPTILALVLAALPISLQGQEESIPTPRTEQVSPAMRPVAPPMQPIASAAAEKEAAASVGPRSIVEKFFATLGLGKVEEAYAKLTEGSTIRENANQLEMLQTKTDGAIEEFGRIEGQELVEMEWAGSSLVRLTYLSLGEKFPLRWRFYFYQRNGVWRLVDIRVDDRLKDLFHESGDSEGTQ